MHSAATKKSTPLPVATTTEIVLNALTNPFLVQETSVWFDQECELLLHHTKLKLNRKTTARMVMEECKATELADLNGHLLLKETVLFELSGVRLAFGWRRYRVKFAKPFSVWLNRKTVELETPTSFDTIEALCSFSDSYKNMSAHTAGFLINRGQLYSAFAFALSHSHNVEKVLKAKQMSGFDSKQIGPFFTDVIAVCKALEKESAKSSTMSKAKHTSWSSKIALAAALLKHAVQQPS